MTVSTDSFDFIFSQRNKLERREAALESGLVRSRLKLDKFLDLPQSLKRERKIGRLEGIISSRENRLATTQADLAEINEVNLPQDQLIINWSPMSPRTYGVSLQESPYDDLFDAGEEVRVGVRGTKENGSFFSTQLVLNHPEYTGDVKVLGDSTYEYSGLNIRNYDDYDFIEIYVSVGGEDLATFAPKPAPPVVF